MSKARSARTGQYVTKAKAAKRPSTTVVEKKKPSVAHLKKLVKEIPPRFCNDEVIAKFTTYLAKFK